MLNGENSNQMQDIATDSNVNVVSQEADIPKPEKTFTQEDINNIVKGVKKETYEKGRRDALAEHQKSETKEVVDDEKIKQLVDSQVDRKVSDIIRKAQEEDILNASKKTIDNFVGKLKAFDKEKYPDFEDTVRRLNLPTLVNEAPFIVAAVADFDNAADVMYDLGKNMSTKVPNLINTYRINPEVAIDELKKLSKSIKSNEDAKKKPFPKEPLSQIKPSITGIDNGSMTVSDFRKLLNSKNRKR